MQTKTAAAKGIARKRKAIESPMAKKSSPKKYSAPSDSDGSSFGDDRDDKPDQKKIQSHRRKTKDHQRICWQITDSDQDSVSRDSSAALSERSNQSSDRTDFDSYGDERRQRERQSRLQVVRLLSVLFARAADCPEYKLVNNKCPYQDLFRRVSRFLETTDVGMRPHVSSGIELTAFLSYLAKLKEACNLNRVLESIAV